MTGRPPPPTGDQLLVAADGTWAVVTGVGAGLRFLAVGDVEVLDGFGEQERCDGARGQLLLPWPNRVDEGRYRWADEEHRLPLTEPAKANAIHGLTRWARWTVTDHRADSVSLAYLLPPQTGWPFQLDCAVRYAVEGQGVRVDTTLVNVGSSPAPVAAGAHPYLGAGGGLIDDCRVRIPARTVLPVDPRGIPTGRQPVDGTGDDFRRRRLVGGQQLDITFTDVDREPDGTWLVTLERPDGTTVGVAGGAGYPYIEVFTGDTLAPHRRRRGLGVEPMTAPPNALRTGEALQALGPGETLALSFWVGLV